MDQSVARRLRGLLNTLERQHEAIRDHRAKYSDDLQQRWLGQILEDVEAASALVPGVMPAYHVEDFIARPSQHREYFSVQLVGAYLNRAIPQLEAALGDASIPPAGMSKEFPFISDPQVRASIERDYLEITKVFQAECWKASLVLSGSVIEAILYDDLMQMDEAELKTTGKGKPADLSKWNLSDLLDASRQLERIPAGVAGFCEAVKEYRNLIHPGRQRRTGLRYGREEASLAFEFIGLLHREKLSAGGADASA